LKVQTLPGRIKTMSIRTIDRKRSTFILAGNYLQRGQSFSFHMIL